MSNKAFEILDETIAYQGYFSLRTMTVRHELFAGGWSPPLKRELFQRGECVAVVLYDPDRDAVVLIEQFRVGAIRSGKHPWLIEIVAGAIEPGEVSDDVARREALEEARCEIRHLIHALNFYTSPGASSELVALYCGIVDGSDLDGICGLAEEHEDIRVETVPFDDAMRMVAENRIDSGVPLVGLFWLATHRDELRLKYGSARE